MTNTSTRIRRGAIGVIALLAMFIGGLGLVQEVGAVERVGTPAPCFVSWPAKGKVPTSIGCSPSSYFNSGDFRVYSKTANIVGITTHKRMAGKGFIVCNRAWGSQCKYAGSANP